MATDKTPTVPAEARAALQAVVNSKQARWYLSAGEKIEFTAAGFCAWYMAERQRIREQVAEEILGDVEQYFAARIRPEMWEAAYRAAYVARNAPSANNPIPKEN